MSNASMLGNAGATSGNRKRPAVSTPDNHPSAAVGPWLRLLSIVTGDCCGRVLDGSLSHPKNESTGAAGPVLPETDVLAAGSPPNSSGTDLAQGE